MVICMKANTLRRVAAHARHSHISRRGAGERNIGDLGKESHTALIIFLKRFQAVSSAAMPVLARGALCPSPLVDAA